MLNVEIKTVGATKLRVQEYGETRIAIGTRLRLRVRASASSRMMEK